nr:hypothetical protein [Tanacetum cinerariifolium]
MSSLKSCINKGRLQGLILQYAQSYTPGAVSAKRKKLYHGRTSGEIILITIRGCLWQSQKLLTKPGPTIPVPINPRDHYCPNPKNFTPVPDLKYCSTVHLFLFPPFPQLITGRPQSKKPLGENSLPLNYALNPRKAKTHKFRAISMAEIVIRAYTEDDQRLELIPELLSYKTNTTSTAERANFAYK